MNLKKILSTVAALAIAASSFAGLSITANAEEVVVINTNFGANSTEELANGENYTWGTGFTRAEGDLHTDKADHDTIDGGCVRPNHDGNEGELLTFTNPLEGNIAINFNFYSYGANMTNTGGDMVFYNSEGNKVFSFRTKHNGWGFELYLTDSTGVETMLTDFAFDDKSWSNEANIVVNTAINTVTFGATTISIPENSDIKTIKLGGNSTNAGRSFFYDNLSIVTKVAPFFNLSEEEVTVDAETDAVIDVTDIIGEITAESDSANVTADYLEGKLTISYADSGVATVTVTATSDGLTYSKDIFVKSGSVAKTTVTVQYVNAANPEEKLLETDATIADVIVGDTIDLTDYTDDVTSFTKNGIEYTATYDETDVSAVAVTDSLVYKLKYNLTEKEYTATITTAPYAQVVITGTTTSGAEFAGVTVYSNASGVATANLKQGNYNAAVSKGGYTSSETNAVVVTTANVEVSAPLTTEEQNVLYYEDFNTAIAEGMYFNASMADTSPVYAWGMSGSGAKIGAQTTNGTLILSSSNGARSVTKDFGATINATNNYKVSFKLNASESSDYSVTETLAFADSSNKVLFGLSYNTGTWELTAYTGTLGDGNNADTQEKTYPIGVFGNKETTVECVVIGNKAVLTVSDGTNTNTVAMDITSAQLAKIRAFADKNMKFTIDDFVVVNYVPAVTADLNTAPADATAPTTPATMTDAADGETTVNYTDVVTAEDAVTTVYVKVENAVGDAIPVVYLDVDGEEVVLTATKATKGIDNYFIIQYVDNAEATVSLTKVTYEGAVDYTPAV